MEAATSTTDETRSHLPTLEEARELVPRKDGPVWRLAGDPRGGPTAGYAVLLQVAHPTVGAGVAQYSGFLDDPWGRLMRTLDYVHGTVYGGPELARDIGARVHGIHKHIKGTKPNGEPYHALEPRAYAWVHATLASALVDGHRFFGTPMAPHETQDFYDEWRRLGRLIGVRDDDLPADWAGFREYFDATIAGELQDNPTVHVVLETLGEPAPPPVPEIPPALWKVLRRPMSGQARLMTVGMLPPALRDKLGLPWTRRQDAAFRALARVLRASRPLIVGPLREFGVYYVRWRREALERGDVAKRSGGPKETRPAAGALA
jgi:uncharacterized protein (DUF2236 family)